MKKGLATVVGASLLLTGTATAMEKESHYNYRYVKYFLPAQSFAKGSGTGNIKGRVVYVGKRKLKNRKKLITKDKEVCGRGYKIDRVYELSKDGGVKNAVVFLNISGGGKDSERLVQRKCEFHPRVVSLTAGGTLEVVNEDEVKHEANGVQDFETIFQLSQHKKGMVDRVKLKKPGVVEVTCNIHGWMKGWVVVAPGPYHAVTDERGNFVIEGVPAGTHTLRLWHEGFGEKKLRVKVQEGKTSTVTFELR
ncbi:carboxypeptidase regulatory-like domain-containing protein [Hydrogenivirga sp. 128-5-R1-1]|uniref:carboxypeptidase regulatory-like domain-containing protein n=1 Tax=Hydrogenivirga sp. 128-5-R1-1 TaxID=392423 RepID=UPI00015F36C6|nr:carboxypeptidase regulatory-like domain-containing protein [Hydrogenivirga sp. 128-5-R1-1]EDP76341.1 putative lipoprotein [Hydrogenivirga sp. 128-5-R1-1]